VTVPDGTTRIDEGSVPPLAVRHAARALAEVAPQRVSGPLLHTPFLRPALIRPLVRARLAALASPPGVLYAPLRRGADQADLIRADVPANRGLARDPLTVERVGALRRPRPLGVLVAGGDALVDAAASRATSA